MGRLATLVLFVALGATGPAAGPAAKVLPWVEDDYPRALAQARARSVPLFVEAWAPW